MARRLLLHAGAAGAQGRGLWVRWCSGSGLWKCRGRRHIRMAASLRGGRLRRGWGGGSWGRWGGGGWGLFLHRRWGGLGCSCRLLNHLLGHLLGCWAGRCSSWTGLAGAAPCSFRCGTAAGPVLPWLRCWPDKLLLGGLLRACACSGACGRAARARMDLPRPAQLLTFTAAAPLAAASGPACSVVGSMLSAAREGSLEQLEQLGGGGACLQLPRPARGCPARCPRSSQSRPWP